ncbi:COP9 signalosome complex subunit 6 [Porphyridium purpureum]|uniref:COP9 signalosome complex subunit 6 n=1 Tax=Porphyridium purpureum TaxID=35688 RepID=A0A5J4Z498_PORPP|nr:COP9 signalosome complex subunit 6 [Porphyridium purpureum]|eukprot:POR3529..scf295_1
MHPFRLILVATDRSLIDKVCGVNRLTSPDDRRCCERTHTMSALVHPLVLMNISDHVTRLASHAGHGPAASATAIGLLLGIQKARLVELHHSFELSALPQNESLMVDTGASNEIQVDAAFLSVRAEQYKKVFPQYDVVGWYRTLEPTASEGGPPLPSQIPSSCKELHRELAERIGIERGDSFLMLLFNPFELMDPTPRRSDRLIKELPLALYEESFSAPASDSFQFAQIQHAYASEASEHVAMDHVTHRTTSIEQGQGAELLQFLNSALNAVSVLQRLIGVVRSYVADVHEHRTPMDRDIMRRIASVCACVRMLKPQALEQSLQREHVDGSIKTLMAATTKALSDISDLIDHYGVVASKQQKRVF